MGRPRTTSRSGMKAPTKELGALVPGSIMPGFLGAWSTFKDEQERTPELQWPASVQTYEEMRNDAQIAALLHATFLGMHRMRWSIDPNEAPEEMVEKMAGDYNLPVLGEDQTRPRLRRKKRFIFGDHQRLAYKAMIYGHYYFNQVGEYTDDMMWHLRKLAPRPPYTIQDFIVAEDGGLVAIVQNISSGSLDGRQGPYYAMLGANNAIPVDNLIGYVWDREGANWAGRSFLRELYKDFVIKDRLTRIDAINHERAGGVPYIEANEGATYADIDKLNQMARQFRIGDTAGGAIPYGAKFNIAKGTNSSVVESIQYHDELMARRFMLMVMQLGQTQTGSRALGTSFLDFWAAGLEAVAEFFRDTFNEFMIEDDVDWNWGEEEEVVPLLHFEHDPEFSIDSIKIALDGGAIQMDDEMEDYVRKEMGWPKRGTPRLSLQQETEIQQAEADREIAKTAAAQPARQPAAGAGGGQKPQ